jgi:hypothetical protein
MACNRSFVCNRCARAETAKEFDVVEGLPIKISTAAQLVFQENPERYPHRRGGNGE